MKTKIPKSILYGVISTLIFTIVTLIAPLMGLPKMSPPAMLSMMMGMPILIGWMTHFMIGILFTFTYTYFFNNLVRKISNNIFKGIIFGFAVFILAQMVMVVMGMISPLPAPEGSMMLMIIVSLFGHIVFGVSVSVLSKSSE